MTVDSKLSFIWDPWCGGISIADYLKEKNIIANFSQFYNLKVSSFILDMKWEIPHCFDNYIGSLIRAVKIENQPAAHLWLGNHNPLFTNFTTHFYAHLETVEWFKQIWHKKFSLRFAVYTWLAFKRGLKTADALAIRGIITQNCCCFCHNYPESITHLFFECDFCFSIAKNVLPWLNNWLLRPNLSQLFNSISDQAYSSYYTNVYLLSASAMIYFLWRARNDRIFGGIVDYQNTVISKIKKAVIWKTQGWKKT
ncbi:uncharacterized protein LOC110109730 [Dendrobium catenatum]|uniref:uncharacterized protein LOC110109730 n=1 Tax=Dendrobium catenatum TaxID=906689 RepID=UPI0009F4C642|nr:uncharacterized protein LOC110109730 [Dendrobium catenatum]